MSGIQAGGGSAGRLSIEIVAEVARLQADMDKVKRLVKDASNDIAKSANHANDNVGKLGSGLNKASGNARGFSLQMSQVGQQVMAGTSLIQALAMQLPDVAAGMNAGTAGGSKFATFLGGPWGIAITTAIGLAATFAYKLLDTEDAAGKATKGQRSLADVLSDGKSSWVEITKAAKDYADQQDKTRVTTLETIKTNAVDVKVNLDKARAIRIALAADLEAYESITRRGAQSEAGDFARNAAFGRADMVREKMALNAEAIKNLSRDAKLITLDYAELMAKLANDPSEKIRSDFEALRRQTESTVKGTRNLAAALTSIGAAESKALEQASQANRKHADETVKLAKVTGAEIAKALGTRANGPDANGTRSAAHNKEIGGAKNSYHLTGQAVDIPLSVGGKPFTKAGIRAALAPLGVQIKELLGPGDKGHNDHFHIAFGVKRLAPDQVRNMQDDAASAARKASEKAEDELTKFRVNSVKSFYALQDLLDQIMAPAFKQAADAQDALWDQMNASAEKAANAGMDGAAEAQRAYADWNDELRGTIDLLDDIGSSGRQLGDIGALLAGLTSGDWSGSKGPLGGLMRTLGNTQWRDPADANGLGEIRILREEIVKGLDKVFGGKGSFGKTMNGVLKNAGIGSAAGSVLFGKQSKSEKTGSKIGGAVGGAVGKELLGSVLGEFAGPLGAIAGGILGSVVGGLFKKAKWGRVDLTSAGVSGASGNSSSSEKAALASGNSIVTGLKDLATQLGGVLGDFGSISVGVRNDEYRVNTGGTSLKVKKGAVNFGDDAEAAVAYAMKEAIERGAITGIRNSTNNLLKAGDDLQAQLQKAINFEGVFSELKTITDPVGAALDDVNRQFDQLRVVFKEAGASAEEYAQLEQLLTIKRNEAMDKERDALDDIRSRIAEAQGDDATVKAIARAKEMKDALNDNVRAELQHLYAVEDAVAAQQALTDAQTAAGTSAEQLRDTWASIGADLMDEVNRIRGLTGAGGAASFASLQGQFNTTASSARNGDQAAAAKLVELSQSLIEAAGNAATSRQELDRVKAETAATLEDLARRAGAPAAMIGGMPSTASQSDTVSSGLAETRDEVAAMRKEMMAALSAIASNTGRTARKLDDVTPNGNAISVANAA